MTHVRSTGLGALVLTAICAGGFAFLIGIWWALLAGVNLAAFLFYGFDKHRARGKGWRVPESVLLAFAVFCAAPGSFVGQRVFHHKTSKTSFKRAFWILTILQAAAIIALVVYLRRG
jgi:uncharacterized membrane protein YsdA (DUF1294 family)